MFFEIMRLLDEAAERERESRKLPLMLMAENVKALRPLLPILEAEYAKRGYRTYYTMFNSKYWEVPQNRERYFVVGVRNDLPGEFTFPIEQHDYVPKLSSVLETDVDEKFYISDEKAKVIIDQALKKLESLGYCHATITPDRIDKRQNGRRAKADEEEMFTLTAQDLHGVICRETGLLDPDGVGKTLRVGGAV
jgi:DNA (cytosine-5)-methyltransferase 1